MTSDASHLQFSKKTWQIVTKEAYQCLLRREFCPDQSSTSNLRCVHLEEETADRFGRQLWFFEASAVDLVGRRRLMFGVLEFSVQYGILEASQTALFDDLDQRQTYWQGMSSAPEETVWAHSSTRWWVRLTIFSVVIIALLWMLLLLGLINGADF